MLRESARLAQLRDFRRSFYETAKKSKWMLNLGRKGKVAEIKDDMVRLRFGRSDFEILFASVSTDVFLREATKRKQLEGPQAWLGAYMKLLAGDSGGVDTYLRGSDMASQLRADRGSLDELMADSPAAALWIDVAQAGAPADATRATLLVEKVRELVGSHGGTPLVSERRELLEELARYLLDHAFAPGDAKQLGIVGEVEDLGSGRVRVKHGFDKAGPKDLLDTSLDPFAEWRRQLPPITAPRAPGFKVVDGALEGVGAIYGRYPLPLRAPFKIKMSIAFTGPFEVAHMGVCDDGNGNRITLDFWGSVSIQDQAGGVVGTIESSQNLMLEIKRTYVHEIEHDGKMLVRKIDGKEVARVERVGTRTGGTVYLMIHSNEPVRILDLELEGGIDESQLGPAKQAWVDAEIAKMFGRK